MNPAAPGRRLALLTLSARLLVRVLRQIGTRRVTLSRLIPQDARVVGCRYLSEFDLFAITLESEEFEPVPPGGVVPRLELEVRLWKDHRSTERLLRRVHPN